MNDRLHTVKLREARADDGEVSILEAYVTTGGGLVLEGYDAGPSVEAHWGDSDYEYWLRVEARHVPHVLLELIRERFTSDVEFRKWLDARGIPNQFQSWV